MEGVITAKGLCKSYKNVSVLKDVSINVKEGEIYGLVGKNGAGKTTIMKILLGLVPRTSGEISLLGASSESELRVRRSEIGSMIETPSFYPYMSARDNLNYYRIQRGIKDKGCIDKALRLVGLDDTGPKKFRDFSLGMKQRLGLALATLHSPKLLILDEPINGLDPEGIIEVRDLIRELNQKSGTTVLISSHILGELSQLAVKFGFIDKGRMIKEADIEEIESAGAEETVITVDSVAAASRVAASEFPEAIFTTDKDSIHFTSGYSDGIISAFSREGIAIKGLSSGRETLEGYYMKLLGVKQNG